MCQSQKTDGKLYIPGLDGIRAIAFLLVFAAHAGLDKWIPGGLGVTFFFFLSGYLITTLLRREAIGNGSGVASEVLYPEGNPHSPSHVSDLDCRRFAGSCRGNAHGALGVFLRSRDRLFHELLFDVAGSRYTPRTRYGDALVSLH
jgi:hypothetical protein